MVPTFPHPRVNDSGGVLLSGPHLSPELGMTTTDAAFIFMTSTPRPWKTMSEERVIPLSGDFEIQEK